MSLDVTSSFASRWEPFPDYKDSGVEYIGEIPRGWDIVKLRYLIREKITDGPHETPEFLDAGIPFLSVDGIQDGEIQFDGCRYISLYAHKLYKKKCIIEKNDILMGKAASTGKIARIKVDFEFSIWSPLALIKPKVKDVDPIYLEYCLKSNIVQYQINILCTYNTQKNISMNDIPNIIITLPKLEIQHVIADFLDSEMTKIDALISKKEHLITLLQEKRTALISHAVTKGLHPDVPMKESEIPTIGKIPSHWNVKRNKHIFKEINERSTTGTEELLTVSHITGVTPRSEKDVNMFMAESLEGYKRCRQNDLIINTMWAWMGALGTSKQEGIVSPSYNVYRLINENNYNSKYLDFLYRTPSYICEITRHSKGVWSSRLRLYPDSFFEICTIEPPLSEQQQILEYIYMKIQKADIFLEKLKESIEKLREYRTAFISAAVTGKIDVTNGDY